VELAVAKDAYLATFAIWVRSVVALGYTEHGAVQRLVYIVVVKEPGFLRARFAISICTKLTENHLLHIFKFSGARLAVRPLYPLFVSFPNKKYCVVAFISMFYVFNYEFATLLKQNFNVVMLLAILNLLLCCCFDLINILRECYFKVIGFKHCCKVKKP
jgi:hypothetical protein